MTRLVGSSASLPLLVVVFGLWFVASLGNATDFDYYDPLSLTTTIPPADYDDDTTKFLVEHRLYITGCDKYCPGKCAVRPQSSEIICVCGRGKGIRYSESYSSVCQDCYCGQGEISCSFDVRGSKRCFCEAGYEFRSGRCSKRKRPCHINPCRNGGVCWEQNDHASYICTCPQTHTGTNCERGLNACNSNPCKNGAACWHAKNFRYLCICQKNHTGKNCEREINVCDTKPCSNGGTCYRGNGSDYFCSCQETHTGKNCETEINPCDAKPCKNGGTCWRGEGINYICTCVNDNSGKNCDNKKTTSTSPVTSTPLFLEKQHG